MSEAKGSTDTVFEINRIRKLVELMKEHDLSEVDLRESRQRIRICRGPKEGPRPAYGPPPPPPPSTVGPSPPTSAPAASASADAANIALIKSPMVGTFYATPNPDSPPFAAVGTPVAPDKVVCIIEAMKIFNEIKAECTGVIHKVLVKSGEPVEFGQPLFLVKPG